MAGYWVVRGSAIKDEAAAKEYVSLWMPIGQRYGAQVIAGKGAIDTREGAHYPRQLIIRFPRFDDAVACYQDPEYEKAMEFARLAFDRELSILEG